MQLQNAVAYLSTHIFSECCIKRALFTKKSRLASESGKTAFLICFVFCCEFQSNSLRSFELLFSEIDGVVVFSTCGIQTCQEHNFVGIVALHDLVVDRFNIIGAVDGPAVDFRDY